jgi:hypothetical protein
MQKTTMGLRIAFAGALLLGMTGCVTTNAAMLGMPGEQRPEVEPDRVALYRVASQVPGPYEEVALLNSTGDSDMTNEAGMYESMREKAGEIGANGVILDALSEPGSGAKVAGAIFGVSVARKGKALAIWVYPAGQQPVASATASLPPAPVPAPQPMQPAPAPIPAAPVAGVNPPVAMPVVAPVAAPVAAPATSNCASCQGIVNSYQSSSGRH